MSNEYKTRDLPIGLKILLGTVTILTAVNTFLSGFTNDIKEEARSNVTTVENIQQMNHTLDRVQKRLNTAQGAVSLNTVDIQSLQTNIKNMKENQENVREDLRMIDRKIDKVYSILLDMQRGN